MGERWRKGEPCGELPADDASSSPSSIATDKTYKGTVIAFSRPFKHQRVQIRNTTKNENLELKKLFAVKQLNEAKSIAKPERDLLLVETAR
jgi:hypothetical protein